ncbi:MAG TPA: tRNA pseudouridine(38-40) synthase TruA [Kiritimatiellia bacterium]|nr:tRNA pseudouridine(38-40) synthase TruA [Kiritimatiellia bacterium]
MKSGVSRRFKLIIGYDGTAYSGWQVQPGKRTVQGCLEEAILQLSGETTRVFCSGRTDAGVHARGQVIHVDVLRPMAPEKLRLGLNRFLPEDIRVLTAHRATSAFDARMSAVGKEYRYFICNEPVLPPHLRLYHAHVYRPLSLSAMQEAARRLEGRHDFAAFSANPGHEREGTVRTLFALRVSKSGAQVMIRAIGDGFLFKMVRSLAGFLIRVGVGDLAPENADSILQSKTRTARVPTADPQGLFLWRVYYRPVSIMQPSHRAPQSRKH